MSADNRILIHHDGDYWRVWEGSCSVNYYEPPEDALEFESYDEADHHAQEQAQGMLILEGGVQILSPEEVFDGLLEQQEEIKIKLAKQLELIRQKNKPRGNRRD